MSKKAIVIGYLLVVCFLFSNQTKADESYGSCRFEFSTKDVEREFASTGLSFDLMGVDSFKHTVYEDLCKQKENATFIISDNNPEDKYEPFKRPKDHWIIAKVVYNSCSFEYEFGIENNQYIRINHFSETCLTNSTKGNKSNQGLRLLNKVSKRGDTWGVICNNRVHGMVTLDYKYGSSYEVSSICASGANKDTKCKIPNEWNINQAAQYLCQ